jgi:hypothetical protein
MELTATASRGALEEEMEHWHIWEAPWKVERILRMLARHQLQPQTICEIGSGSGDILEQLQARLSPDCNFQGYEISPIAIQYSQQKQNGRLHFKLCDIRDEAEASYDVMLIMDVVEHLEHFLGFLREVRSKATYKIFQVSLTITAQGVLRKGGLPRMREVFGFRNLFTKEIFLQALRDTGYEIVDWFYTIPAVEVPSHQLRRKLMKIPRKLMFALSQDWTARTLGGCRLLVLAK